MSSRRGRLKGSFRRNRSAGVDLQGSFRGGRLSGVRMDHFEGVRSVGIGLRGRFSNRGVWRLFGGYWAVLGGSQRTSGSVVGRGRAGRCAIIQDFSQRRFRGWFGVALWHLSVSIRVRFEG